MAIKTLEEVKKYGSTTIICGYSYEEETPEEKNLIYKLNKMKKKIEFFPAGEHTLVDTILFEGFSEVPDPFNIKGYSRGNILYYISTNFAGLNVKTLTVLKTGANQLIKRGKNNYLKLNIATLKDLADEIGSMRFYHNAEKASFARKHFNKVFPNSIKLKQIKNPRYKIKHAIRMLNAQKVDTFDKYDIDNVLDIVGKLLKTKYKSKVKKSELFQEAKYKVDTLTLDSIITEFETMLSSGVSESSWGKFLKENLFLIDPKYIHVLPELNLMLGTTRKVDFGLVDVWSYLDIYEIKKPETKLLESKTDHGNYIWHKDAIKAIVQAEKYLENAQTKAANLQKDIKREKNIDLGVISPRAVVVMGSSKQLDDQNKKDDFRLLKSQFKNIEIVLYDELLEKLKNQKKKFS